MKKILLSILLSLLFSSDFSPNNNIIINHTHVFFKWPQITNAVSYLFSIDSEYGNFQAIVSHNSIILDEFLDWNNSYSWTICSLDINQNVIDCYDPYNFSINSLPGYFPNQSEVIFNSGDSFPGITMLDFDSKNFSAAINNDGIPIWFVDKNLFGVLNPRIILTQVLSNGNFIGYGTGIGYEFDINGNIIYQTPGNIGVHHHMIKTSNNTYLIIDAIDENHPCPDNCPDNLPETISWKGDHFIEINSEQEILWDWNTFDFFDLSEYNPLYLERFSESYPTQSHFDWTHANSVFYDSNNDDIYVSIRNLSRIVKIDYSTGNIVWHIGNIDFMNNIFFEQTLDFSQQHSVKMINNNNLLFFDNHSYLTPEISRCVEFNINENLQEPEIIWEYTLPDSLFTGSRGECDRLDNGNTLISVGRTGNVLEVDEFGSLCWHYQAKHNNQAVTIYRSERVPSLYALAYSFEINNLYGDYYEGYFIESSDSLLLTIFNMGFHDQIYYYELYDNDNGMLLSDSIYVDVNENQNIQLILSDIVGNNESYYLSVYPISNELYVQGVDFEINPMYGDANNDGDINVQDAIILVSAILNSEYSDSYDLNNDQVINIIDIVFLINLILNHE